MHDLEKNTPKLLCSILIISIGMIFASGANSAELLNGDDFAKNALWSGLGVVENAKLMGDLTKLDRYKRKACVVALTDDFTNMLYTKPNAKYSKSQIMKIASDKILKNKDAVSALVSSCASRNIDSETFSELVSTMLTSTRPLTDFNELKGNFESYQNKTVRLEVQGVMLSDTLLINEEKGLNTIPVDTTSLTKETLTLLYKKCGKAGLNCKLELWGTVDTTDQKEGLIAKQVEFR